MTRHDDEDISVDSATSAFAVVPHWAIFSNRLTNTQFRVYTVLCLYANKYDYAWPKVETMGEKMGITHQAISKTVRELAKLGLVEVKKHGFPAKNRYYVVRGPQAPAAFLEPVQEPIASDDEAKLQPVVATTENDTSSCNPTLHQLQPVVASVATSEVADKHTNRTNHKNTVSHVDTFSSSLARSAETLSAREAASPERRTRERDFDESALRRDPLTLALVACLGHAPATRREWGQWRMAINDLHTANAEPDDIPRAIRGYQATYPRARVTPLALVSHWSEIQEGKPHDIAQLEISRRASAATAAQKAERERADAERKAQEQREVQRLLSEYGYEDCP